MQRGVAEYAEEHPDSPLAVYIGSVIGEYSAYKSGHELNNKLLRTLLANEAAYEEVTFTDPKRAPISYATPAYA